MRWLDRRLCIGRFASIKLYLHWSLLIMIAYVVALSYQQGGSAVAMSLAQLAGMFVCVTLHEYGHALAARYYGIGTVDITLLAIGGIARLRSMPRVPIHEMVVAIAGPAVNVAIAIGITCVLFVTDPVWFWRLMDVAASVSTIGGGGNAGESLVALMENIGRPDLVGYLLVLLLVNVVLVVFNFVPAFPMDGGRVLRAILAMMMDYRRATFLASRIAWAAAALMAISALLYPEPLLVPLAIAVFIVYAGLAEYRQVATTESVRGMRVREAIVRSQVAIPINATVAEAAEIFAGQMGRRLPIVGVDKIVTGTVTLDQIIERLTAVDDDDPTPIGVWMDHQDAAAPIEGDEWLADVLPSLGRQTDPVPVVDRRGSLIGMLDTAAVVHRHRLNAATGQRFDRTV